MTTTENQSLLQLHNYRKPEFASAGQLQKTKIDFSLITTENQNWLQLDNYRKPKLTSAWQLQKSKNWPSIAWTTTEIQNCPSIVGQLQKTNIDFSLTTTENQNWLQLENYRKPKLTSAWQLQKTIGDYQQEIDKIDFSLTTTENQNWLQLDNYRKQSLTSKLQKTRNWTTTEIQNWLQLDNYRKPKVPLAWQLQKTKIDFSLITTENQNWLQLDNYRKPKLPSAWQLQKSKIDLL